MAGLGFALKPGVKSRVISNLKQYAKAVDKKMGDVDRNMKKAFLWGARQWERETKKRVPKVTGELARTFRSRVVGRRFVYKGPVGSPDIRSLWLEFGTRPYIIRPKKARRLTFLTPSGWRTALQVRHPGIRVGTPENPRRGWLRRTAREKSKQFIRAGSRESMPYLRPAWRSIRKKVLRRLRKVI